MILNREPQKMMLRIARLFCVILVFASCQAQVPIDKYNGISLVASRDTLLNSHITPLKNLNANAVAVMPFAFIRDKNNPQFFFNNERQWYGERVSGVRQSIQLLHQQNLKVMLKPQIWINRGEFTGDLVLEKEEQWQAFEAAYREYILLYADIAEQEKVELFCIGTELYGFVNARPEFWKKLISELRERYSGKLTYAENWDKVDQTKIWEDLDFIGVDAYFPISGEISPLNDEIREGWKIHKTMLSTLSRKYNKPMLFTEFGYRNVDYALKEPWNSDRNTASINHNLQARALEVLIDEFWGENWFSGGFLWKWHHFEHAGGLENNRFTPQNKPAEAVIRKAYAKFKI